MAAKKAGVPATVNQDYSHVSTVMDWYRTGTRFKNDDEARGAFRLAYLQATEDMGASPCKWMGLTEEQYDAFVRRDELPKLSK